LSSTIIQSQLIVSIFIFRKLSKRPTKKTKPTRTTNNLNTNITVANLGDFTENFNITLYADATVIETIGMILEGGTSLTIVFPWNTTGFAHGNYTLWAHAEPVPGETSTGDNTFVYGWVSVTIPGDVDGDGDVDPADFYIFAGNYGSSPPSNPNCDLDGDGDVGPDDFYIFSGNYGKTAV